MVKLKVPFERYPLRFDELHCPFSIGRSPDLFFCGVLILLVIGFISVVTVEGVLGLIILIDRFDFRDFREDFCLRRRSLRSFFVLIVI